MKTRGLRLAGWDAQSVWGKPETDQEARSNAITTHARRGKFFTLLVRIEHDFWTDEDPFYFIDGIETIEALARRIVMYTGADLVAVQEAMK